MISVSIGSLWEQDFQVVATLASLHSIPTLSACNISIINI